MVMEDKAVTALVQRVVDAWNCGDAAAFAAHFTPNADYVGADGVLRQGRQAIEEMRRTAEEAPRVAIEGPVTVRSHLDVWIALFRWSSQETTGAVRRGLITCAVVNQGGQWLVDSLHNTNAP